MGLMAPTRDERAESRTDTTCEEYKTVPAKLKDGALMLCETREASDDHATG